jgi:putative nucleotidyltransferase with HDIG domain
MVSDVSRRTPPRFVTRTLIATLAMVAFVLAAVITVVTLSVRNHVRRSVVEKLETAQHLLAVLEERRVQDLRTRLAPVAENPALRAAFDSYEAERRTASPAFRGQLIATVQRELDKLAERAHTDVLAARNIDGDVLAVSGHRALEWTAEDRQPGHEGADATLLTLSSGVFRAVTGRVSFQENEVGSVQLAQALDDRYVTGLSALSGAKTLIVSNDRILATTLPPETAAAIDADALAAIGTGALTTVGGEEYAVRPLLQDGGAAVYVLDSIDASANPLLGSSRQSLAAIALGGFFFAALASFWLARQISRPIDTLSASLTEMTRTRRFDRLLPVSGASLEVDSLTDAFNVMMSSVKSAEAETLSAYLEAIRALAMALDARDPYTAGHSERVSMLSVAIGREMRLDATTLEVLRLGALLHDIGKIGISDNLLRKPAPLTPEEYEVIKTHPAVGSRILRHVRFLEPHLPVVELHHERPDGTGYPYGLRGDQIPVAARIVHVADAYDALTSARAYRPARPADTGFNEILRCAGTDFDVEVVKALARVLALEEDAQALDAFSSEGTREAPTDDKGPPDPDPLDAFSSEGRVA